MGVRGSNPRVRMKNPPCCHYTNPQHAYAFARGMTSRVPGRRFGCPVPGTAFR